MRTEEVSGIGAERKKRRKARARFVVYLQRSLQYPLSWPKSVAMA